MHVFIIKKTPLAYSLQFYLTRLQTILTCVIVPTEEHNHQLSKAFYLCALEAIFSTEMPKIKKNFMRKAILLSLHKA